MMFEFREEYIANRNLVAWSFCDSNNPAEVVYILITHDRSDMRVTRVDSAIGRIPLISIDDLIAMKRSTGRAGPRRYRGPGEAARMRPVQYFSDEYLEHCRAMRPDQTLRCLLGILYQAQIKRLMAEWLEVSDASTTS